MRFQPSFLTPSILMLIPVPSTPGQTFPVFPASELFSVSCTPSKMPTPATFAHQTSCPSCKVMPRCQHLRRPRRVGSLFLPPLLPAPPWVHLTPICLFLFEPQLSKDTKQSSQLTHPRFPTSPSKSPSRGTLKGFEQRWVMPSCLPRSAAHLHAAQRRDQS